MATVTVSAAGPSRKVGGLFRREFTFVVTGTYTTSGDTLDLSAISPASAGKPPVEVRIKGYGTTAGLLVVPEIGLTSALCKIWIYTNSAGGSNSVLTEHTNAAVVAGVSDTTWRGTAEWSAVGEAVSA